MNCVHGWCEDVDEDMVPNKETNTNTHTHTHTYIYTYIQMTQKRQFNVTVFHGIINWACLIIHLVPYLT